MNIIPNHSVQHTLYTSSYSSLISSNNVTMEKTLSNSQPMSITEFQCTVPSVQILSWTVKIIFIAQISKMCFLIKVCRIYLH